MKIKPEQSIPVNQTHTEDIALTEISTGLKEAVKLPLEKKKETLEKIYQQIKHVSSSAKLNQYAAEVCSLYAKTYYGDDFTKTKQLLLNVLEFQFYNANLTSRKIDLKIFDSLSSWETSVGVDVPAFEGDLTKIAPESILKAIENLKDEQKYVMGTTFQWLGYCLQNIGAYNTEENRQTHKNLFFAVDGTAEAIFKSIEDRDEKYYKELTELHYNTGHFLHRIKNPGDIEGACRAINKVLERDNSLSMQARVINLKNCLDKNMQNRLVYAKTTLAIRKEMERIKDPGVNPFLYANAKNVYASIVIDLKKEDEYEEAEKLVLESCQYAKEENDKGNDHSYFGGYFSIRAKLRLLRGDKEAAKSDIDEAIKRFTKHKESSQDALDKALDFKKLNF